MIHPAKRRLRIKVEASHFPIPRVNSDYRLLQQAESLRNPGRRNRAPLSGRPPSQ
jgi:hypothetical protein